MVICPEVEKVLCLFFILVSNVLKVRTREIALSAASFLTLKEATDFISRGVVFISRFLGLSFKKNDLIFLHSLLSNDAKHLQHSVCHMYSFGLTLISGTPYK